ncbi:cytochrome P450 [Iodidimonas nitroreducens]|uniref:Cytochrome P450 n=1 Tax=Iodidimonas nitroreducens TaxID=1236968 RepID=A0A5A7N6P2_9PROT|nr:cytochrome P450 [Iodidimonas nitroreducens]GAK32152.1 putative cytochrome P450 136 [alpha proteobacterium Q-1]GER02696.1 cytochrome P450 [Iodidimonas nitroreducens]
MASLPAKLRRPSKAGRLDHIPGEKGWPILGNTLEDFRDPRAYTQRMLDRYGPVYRHHILFRDQVSLIGPEANEFFFLDRDKALSSEQGWMLFLKDLFPRGLMLLDFDVHRAHRKIMGVAFKTPAMRHYCTRLNAGIPQRIDQWGKGGRFLFYDAIKTLSLDMASDVFLGMAPGAEAAAVNKALSDMVAASMAMFRYPLPGTLYGRGVAGRRAMGTFFGRLIPQRRGTSGSDTFSLLCNATDEKGEGFSDQQIIDHMNFLWMAAHDTITSSVTTLIYELGRNPDWQDRLADECAGLGTDHLDHEDLGRLELVDHAFKEAMRLNAPVPALPRMTIKDVDFGGYEIPKGTLVGISPTFVHRMRSLWPDPERFDPMRFSDEGGVRERHKYAYVPFGGGAHMCLGLHFATMQAKIILFHLLRHWRIRLDRPDYQAEFQIMPLTKPKCGLPLELVRR